MSAQGFYVQRQNYITLYAMANDLIVDLLANGFTQLWPTQAFTPSPTFKAFSITLQSAAGVDPLFNTQPYIVRIELTAANVMKLDVSTPTQLNTTDGTLQYVDTAEGSKATFWDRSARDSATDPAAWPVSYVLSQTARGFALAAWENNYVPATGLQNFAAIAVQRLVDKNSGAARVTGKTPVFAIQWRPGNTGAFWEYFVVREADVLSPTKRQSAETDANDSSHIINARDQVSVSEDGKYVIDFPCRFNTPRFCYTDEFDMIGITSANVVSQGSLVPTTVYGEANPRTYAALTSNSANNTGMRLMVLQNGGGISTS